jgi:hypothetical protein
VLSHPSDKNKNVTRVGHPDFCLPGFLLGVGTRQGAICLARKDNRRSFDSGRFAAFAQDDND